MTLAEKAALRGMTTGEYAALASQQRTVANKANGAAFSRKIDERAWASIARAACNVVLFTAALRRI